MKTVEYNYDFVVAGAGPAGLFCAMSAAREGIKTALVTDRPVLGGNMSKEKQIPPWGMKFCGQNYIFGKETGLTDEDIKSGKVNIMDTGYGELDDAMRMAVCHMKTTTIGGLKNPLEAFAQFGNLTETPEYKTAITFPLWEDGPVIRGVALFLPMEL